MMEQHYSWVWLRTIAAALSTTPTCMAVHHSRVRRTWALPGSLIRLLSADLACAGCRQWHGDSGQDERPGMRVHGRGVRTKPCSRVATAAAEYE